MEASQYSTSVMKVGDYYIFNLKNACTVHKPQKLVNYLVIDNSGSMGNATRDVTNTIAKGMFNLPADKVITLPGVVILFSDNAVAIENVDNVSIDKLMFPPQGSTNITAAIKLAISKLLSQHSNLPSDDRDNHYVLTFLSDGQHNCGNQLSNTELDILRNNIAKQEIKLSVVVVGINNNDTSLGMRIKTKLETVGIDSLKNVYYSKSFRDMQSVLSELVDGFCTNFSSGNTVDLKLIDGYFIENNNPQIKTFLSSNDNFVIVKSTNGNQPQLHVDDNLTQVTESTIEFDDISQAINILLPKLSKIKIAYDNKHIDQKIKTLENLLDTAEIILQQIKSPNVNISTDNLTAKQRLNLLKQVRQSTYSFREERNKLKALLVNVSNDSARQAEYLDGFTKKYANRAIIRADTLSVSVQDVINQLEKMTPELSQCITLDQTLNSSRCNRETQSYLSLNTPLEQLQEWLTFSGNEFTDIYSLLVYLGFTCYPVKFSHNNAVQMDPFQTDCEYIEPHLMDTCNLMLANQTNNKLTTPSRTCFTDGLILVDPQCENSSIFLRKTHIYHYLCSVTLCRDLYMFNWSMDFSMHAHSLKRCIIEYQQNRSIAYLDLAVRIVYSFKKLKIKNDTLFNHWWHDYGTITQSNDDNCNHPIQLLMLLTASDIPQNNNKIALVNMLNEVLARKFKIILSKYTDDDATAFKLAQKLFGIDETNSPTPNPDVMIAEPIIASVRESCQHWANVTDTTVLQQEFNKNTIMELVSDTLLPWVQTYDFCLQLIQDVDWQHRFVTEPDDYLQELNSRLAQIDDVFQYMGENKGENIAATMFLQSLLYHKSSTRVKINEKCVLDSSTFNDLIIDLRMAIYLEACKVKREKWLSVIGDVTYANASISDLQEFRAMIGNHTHGLTKQEFWSLLAAARNNRDKLDIFLSLSNDTVHRCI